jgi:hypothetical protein
MHFGSLPSTYEPGRSYLEDWTPSQLRRDAGISRRAFFGLAPLVLGFTGGIAASVGCLQAIGWRPATAADADADAGAETETGTGRVRPGAESASVAPVQRGSVEWAQWIQRAPENEFLDAAGELERVRMRSPDVRLVPVFQRLLEIALHSEATVADQAGAIAVRCLHKLGADYHLIILDERIDAAPDRPATRRELKRALQGTREGRRR